MIDLEKLKKDASEHNPGHTYFGSKTVLELIDVIEEAKGLIQNTADRHRIDGFCWSIEGEWLSKYFPSKKAKD
jgi:hypothetical protein